MGNISSRGDSISDEELFVELFQGMIKGMQKLTDKLEEVDINLLDLIDHIEQMHYKPEEKKEKEEWIAL